MSKLCSPATEGTKSSEDTYDMRMLAAWRFWHASEGCDLCLTRSLAWRGAGSGAPATASPRPGDFHRSRATRCSATFTSTFRKTSGLLCTSQNSRGWRDLAARHGNALPLTYLVM